MRYVVLLAVLISLPILISQLRNYPHRRAWALAAIGAIPFLGIQTGSFITAWMGWAGTAKGLEVSFVDALALALILTRTRFSARLPFWGVLGFYGFALALSLFSAALPMATFFSIWQYLRLILMFAAVGGELHRMEAQRGLVSGLAIGGIVEAGYVMQQKLTGVVQAGGNIGHQNMLGMMVELALFPILASLLVGDRRKIVLAGAVGFAVVIAGGGSRGTVGFAAVGVLLLAMLSFARSRTPAKLRFAGFLVLVLAAAIPLTVNTFKDRFANGAVIAEDDSREKMKIAARAIAADHPMGIGANQYVNFANKYGYSARAGVDWGSGTLGVPVHQAYLLARAETGWLGEGALILLLIFPLFRGFHFAFSHRAGKNGELVLGSTVAIAVNAAHNNFEYVTHAANVFSLLMLNFAMVAALIRSEVRSARQKKLATGGEKRAAHPIAL